MKTKGKDGKDGGQEESQVMSLSAMRLVMIRCKLNMGSISTATELAASGGRNHD